MYKDRKAVGSSGPEFLRGVGFLRCVRHGRRMPSLYLHLWVALAHDRWVSYVVEKCLKHFKAMNHHHTTNYVDFTKHHQTTTPLKLKFSDTFKNLSPSDGGLFLQGTSEAIFVRAHRSRTRSKSRSQASLGSAAEAE